MINYFALNMNIDISTSIIYFVVIVMCFSTVQPHAKNSWTTSDGALNHVWSRSFLKASKNIYCACYNSVAFS